MTGKLKCPYCRRCIGETITDNADVTVQTMKPKSIQKQKVIIEKICYRCKNHMYMIISDSPTVSVG